MKIFIFIHFSHLNDIGFCRINSTLAKDLPSWLPWWGRFLNFLSLLEGSYSYLNKRKLFMFFFTVKSWGMLLSLYRISLFFPLQVWRPSPVPVWESSSGDSWLRNWTCQLWVPSAWPCWSTWCPLPAMSLFSSWAVTLDLSLGSQWPTAMSKSDDLLMWMKSLSRNF